MPVHPDLYQRFAKPDGYFGPSRLADDHYYTRPILSPDPGPQMQFEGREKIMWSVNNYLGLADHPEIRAVARAALEQHGLGAPMGSRMMTGNTAEHIAFEKELADFCSMESAYLFNYGYLGVIGIVTSLTGPNDTIIMDKLSHACIVDGAFLSGANVRVYKHNDLESLEATFKHINRTRKGGVLLVSEGVYGMTGDVAHLKEMCALKERYEARLFIDDAHGWGVMGTQGRGSADWHGVQDKIDIYFGTFAKSFAAIGGFAAGDKQARDWISYNARTQVFAKSLPMIYIKSLRKTLAIVRDADDNRRQMWAISNALKEGLRASGYYVGTGASPICSVFIPSGGEDIVPVMMRSIRWLRDRDIFVTGVVYPVIPRGLGMFRITPTAAHTQEHVSATIVAFREMRNSAIIGTDVTLDKEARTRLDRLFG